MAGWWSRARWPSCSTASRCRSTGSRRSPARRRPLEALAARLRGRATGSPARPSSTACSRSRSPTRRRAARELLPAITAAGVARRLGRPRPADPRGRLPPAHGRPRGRLRRERLRGPAAQGAARGVADAPPAGARRPVRGRRDRVAAHGALPQRDPRRLRSATSCRSPLPEPTAAMAVEQLQKNLGPARVRSRRSRSRWARSRASSTAGRPPSCSPSRPPARRSCWPSSPRSRSCSAICTAAGVAVAWVYTAILFEPLPIGGLGGVRGPRLARARRLGGA